jgi:chemotaxis family two-component system response regulator PixG
MQQLIKREMIEDCLNEIKKSIEENETGCLEIRNQNQQGKAWLLYFAFGVLIWSYGGEHPQRRVFRQLKKHCPEEVQQGFPIDETVISAADSPSADYDLLCDLRKNEAISINQFIAIQDEVNIEVLFDIFQALTLHNQDSGWEWEWFPKIRPLHYTPIPSILYNQSSEKTIAIAQQQWQKWQKAGLKNCSPNQTCVITDAENIKQTTAAKTFQRLQRLLTGEQTLRDIAIETKRDLLSVTQALWEYYQKGWLRFQDVSDVKLTTLIKQPSPPTSATPQKENNKFLVACVDDSAQVTKTMEEILQSSGYDFIGINDPLRASATLLKVKPNLIFLDLIMPNTNGYEICSQLRKVSSLQEIPIIILTGKDGLIDRMRAKLVGSTEYLSKPVQRSTILEMVQKHLPITANTNVEISTHDTVD